MLPLHTAADGRCSCGNSECFSRGKHPRTPHGVKDATSDVDAVGKLWEKYPDANIGIATGQVSGLMVVDIDPRSGGPETRDGLVELLGPLPNTAEVITGGGGRHVYFRDLGRKLPRQLAPGIELKGEGGYVVAPPSIHSSGNRYEFDGLGGRNAVLCVSSAPQWLLDKLSTRIVSTPQWVDPDSWGPGKRNEMLTSLAGVMRRAGMSRASIEAALASENRVRCNPPLDHEEVSKIAASISRYEPAVDLAPPPITDLAQLPSIFSLKQPRIEYCVDGMLARGSVTLLTAESGTGKTWLAYYIAGRVAHGHPVIGLHSCQMKVLYLDGENPHYVVRQRLDDLAVTETRDLAIWGGWHEWPPAGPEHRLVIDFAREHRGLIVFDSLIEFHPGSEQSATETRAFMRLFRALANLGATVVVLHNAGKSDKAKLYRGSSDIKAAVDTGYALTPMSTGNGVLGELKLESFKARLAPGRNFGLRFVQGEGFRPTEILHSVFDCIAEVLADRALPQVAILEIAMKAGFTRAAALASLKSTRFKKDSGPSNSILYSLSDSEAENDAA